MPNKNAKYKNKKGKVTVEDNTAKQKNRICGDS
jgi:hypothetical protein